MDLNIVTLEITQLIVGFDHYDQLTPANSEDHQKVRSKNREHLALFGANAFYDAKNQLKKLPEIKKAVKIKLTELKAKEIHELIDTLEKDVKKIKKLYKADR